MMFACPKCVSLVNQVVILVPPFLAVVTVGIKTQFVGQVNEPLQAVIGRSVLIVRDVPACLICHVPSVSPGRAVVKHPNRLGCCLIAAYGGNELREDASDEAISLGVQGGL